MSKAGLLWMLTCREKGIGADLHRCMLKGREVDMVIEIEIDTGDKGPTSYCVCMFPFVSFANKSAPSSPLGTRD